VAGNSIYTCIGLCDPKWHAGPSSGAVLLAQTAIFTRLLLANLAYPVHVILAQCRAYICVSIVMCN